MFSKGPRCLKVATKVHPGNIIKINISKQVQILVKFDDILHTLKVSYSRFIETLLDHGYNFSGKRMTHINQLVLGCSRDFSKESLPYYQA